MNKLLPEIKDCEKIVGDWKTFSDCPFNNEFEKIKFLDQLQIINDIVRQTILVNNNPNPMLELSTLEGDSYTASLVALDYLKSMNIGVNHRIVLANKRLYNNECLPSKHTIILVDDLEGNSYQFDCTPNIGYGYGKVRNIKEEKYYDEYIVIDNNYKDILYQTRLLINKKNNNELNDNDIKIIKEINSELSSNEFLKGYYNELNGIEYEFKSDELLIKQLNRWKEELIDLQNSNSDLAKQLELSQALTAEMIKINPNLNKYVSINNKTLLLNSINSRFFYENELTLVLIKPSSYRLGIAASVRDKFLNKGHGAIAEQYVNMGLKSELFNLPLMQCFHPHGYKYERSMNGSGKIFLVDQDPEKTGIIKKEIRNTSGNIVKNHNVEWFDGEPILWNPIVTNLVHSTDDACETAMHFLSPNPEYQIMTRFMYPNPELQKVRKKI